MPKTSNPTEIRAAAGGPSLRGRHARFRLSSRPTWHENGQGQLSCAGAEQTLGFDLILPKDLADPVAARATWARLLGLPAVVRLPSLRFHGYIIASEWQEEANEDGAYSSAIVTFTVLGKEQ